MTHGKNKLAWVVLLLCGSLWGSVWGQSPSGPPTMQHTGDPNADGLRYEQDKAAWLQANPQFFMTQTPTQGASQPMGHSYSAVAGFQPTGNPQVDIPAYEQAKLQRGLVKETTLKEIVAAFVANKESWYSQDPVRYQAYVDAIEAQRVPQTIPVSEFNTFSPAKQAQIASRPGLYTLDPNQ